MTQKEFDEKMMALNAEQRDLVQPLSERMNEINVAKKKIAIQQAELKAQREKLTIEFINLEAKRKAINIEYHNKKHALAVIDPPERFARWLSNKIKAIFGAAVNPHIEGFYAPTYIEFVN